MNDKHNLSDLTAEQIDAISAESALRRELEPVTAELLLRLSPVIRARDEREAAAVFGAALPDGLGRDQYVALRDLIRAALRDAARLQRLRRSVIILMPGPSHPEIASEAQSRRHAAKAEITALIAARRAGKAWAREVVAAARAAEDRPAA